MSITTVAIDGPAGAGKSTLGRAIAQRLGLERLDTGAMYRAVAWLALHGGIDLEDADAVADMARAMALDVDEHVIVDGHDATDAIRSAEVDSAVSIVAANPRVRAEMVRRQQAWVAGHGGGVVEGRDIGTVVLPHADLKIYLTASADERARRRAAERADGRSVDEIAAQLRRRDHLDSTRRASPLPSAQDAAEDALVVDSTDRSVDSIVQEVLGCR